MARRLYDSAANGLDSGDYAWTTGTWKLSLLSAAYTFSSAHDFKDDLSGIIASGSIANRTKTAGVWDADDLTFTGVAAGSTGTAVVIWKDTGTPSTSPLFLFDDSNVLGLPFLTDGGDFIFKWDDGASKIFKISTTF